MNRGKEEGQYNAGYEDGFNAGYEEGAKTLAESILAESERERVRSERIIEMAQEVLSVKIPEPDYSWEFGEMVISFIKRERKNENKG